MLIGEKNQNYNFEINQKEMINLQFFAKKLDCEVPNKQKSYKILFKYFYKYIIIKKD